jgi:hypothetical protein
VVDSALTGIKAARTTLLNDPLDPPLSPAFYKGGACTDY